MKAIKAALKCLPEEHKDVFRCFLALGEKNLELLSSKEFLKKFTNMKDISELTQEEGEAIIKYMEIFMPDRIGDEEE